MILLKSSLFLFLCSVTAFASQSSPWIQSFPVGIYQTKPDHQLGLLGATPEGKPLRANPPDCSAETLEEKISSSSKNLDVEGQAYTLQQFFYRCGKILSRFSPTRIGELIRMADERYSIDGRTDLAEVVFQLPFQITIHGLLALKSDTKPRPWIIVICGTACDLSDSSARAVLAPLFDESPFDVLVLPNVTGNDFIQENHILELGGVEEGRQVFEVIKLLGGSDSPYRSLISSFHILGISLGGNAALMSAVYASYNQLGSQSPKIQSVVGYCPAIDLEKSIDDLDRDDIVGRQYHSLILSRVKEANSMSAPLGISDSDNFTVGEQQALNFIDPRIWPSFADLIQRPNFLLAPFTPADVGSIGDFWRANNFLNSFASVKIPTLIAVSDNDFVVTPSDNFLALQKLVSESPLKPTVAVFHSAKGWHCSMEDVYGEDIFAAAIRSIILKNSPEFHQQANKVDLGSLGLTSKTDLLYEGEKYFGYRWHVPPDKPYVELTFEIWAPYKKAGDTQCSAWSPYYATEECFRQIFFKSPLSIFQPEKFSQELPDRAQAEALTRWFNSQVKIFTEMDQEPVDTTEAPVYVRWLSD